MKALALLALVAATAQAEDLRLLEPNRENFHTSPVVFELPIGEEFTTGKRARWGTGALREQEIDGAWIRNTSVERKPYGRRWKFKTCALVTLRAGADKDVVLEFTFSGDGGSFRRELKVEADEGENKRECRTHTITLSDLGKLRGDTKVRIRVDVTLDSGDRGQRGPAVVWTIRKRI